MSFGTVVGQKSLTTTLRNAVRSGKLAHAYLFCGPRGVGKTTCARIFAKAINCMNPTADGEACNECESCKAFNEQRSYNIFELDAASNNSVENIKSLMEQTRIPPQVGKYKVFIIDEVHMLSTAAFNAFLKTLEEPPAHVIFILATTEKHKILPTILSRCQIYDFERITVETIVSHLKDVAANEGISYEEQALAFIAEKADGGMRDALSIFDQAASFCQGNITYDQVLADLNELDADNYFKMTDLAYDNKVADLMLLLNDIISKGFDGGNVVTGLAAHLRNVLMAKDASTLPLLETSKQQAEKFRRQAEKCSTTFVYRALRILNQCDVTYRASSNKRLLVELTLIEMAQITQPDDDAPGAGLCPKRLKTLFKHIASSQITAVSQVAAGNKPLLRSDRPTRPAVVGDGSTATAAVATTATTEKRTASVARPKLKLGSLGTTFSSLKNRKEKQESEAVEEIKNKDENAYFDNERLGFEWLSMCNRMPQQMVGLSSRLKNVKPVITTFPEVEVVVDNTDLLDQISAIKGRIRVTLAMSLHNGNIGLSVRLAEPRERKPVLTRQQKLEALQEEYKPIKMLRELFNLEFS